MQFSHAILCYLPHKSQYSDQIQVGQLSHTHQADHKPEKEHVTLYKNWQCYTMIEVLMVVIMSVPVIRVVAPHGFVHIYNYGQAT
jgi:hypothetical protein